MLKAPPMDSESGGLKYWAYRMAAVVVPWVPLVVARPAARLVGLGLWAGMPSVRRRADANLCHVPALAADPVRRRRAVRAVFGNLALNYVDLFRAHHLTAIGAVEGWELDGQEIFDAAVAAGRGVVLLTAHLGNFDQAAARLGAMGVPIILPVERLKPARLFQLVCDLRTHHGVRPVPADSPEALRALLTGLRRGEAVLLAVDRDVLGTGVVVPLFGAPARLPTGPILLARRSGAPVIGAFGWRDELGRPRGRFVSVALDGAETPPGGTDPVAGADPAVAGPRVDVRASGSVASGSVASGDVASGDVAVRQVATDSVVAGRPRGRDVMARALVPIARLLEERIAAHPEQWVAALTTVWVEPDHGQDHEPERGADEAPTEGRDPS
jgi:KDO2-lipid IV(A) lauroyltransferase